MTLDAEPPADPEQRPRFFLRVLGPLRISTADDAAVAGLGPGKSLGMLAYMSVRGGARRDELISILWGDIPEANARNAFRQSLHRLRAALGEAILPQDREQVSIGDHASLTVDRDVFLAACDAERWDAAVAAYGGEFLEGFETGESAFDRWADSERVRLRSRYQEALLAAGRQATTAGNVREALRFAELLVAVAPYDEEAALLETNTLVAAGRASHALTAIRQFAVRLHEDLDIQASPAVRALIDRLEKRKDTPKSTDQSPGSGRDRAKPQEFVGRESEIARLIGALAEARAGRGSTIVLEGDAGIGKSRLLDEFAERARNLGGVVLLRGRDTVNGGVIPYAAVAEALRPIVRAAGISGASRHLLAEAARLLPELRDSFDLPAVSALEDETGRLRLFEGVAAVIDAAAYEKPVCLMFDDLQHSSGPTLDLVTYLSQRLGESPVMMILAYRPDRTASPSIERIRDLARTTAGSRDQHIELAPLPPNDIAAIVQSELRRHGGHPPVDVALIVERAAGRPMAGIELARRALAGNLGEDAPVPLRDILWSRLQTASPAQRRIFFAASLFQRTTSLRLLAAAAHLPENVTWDAAHELVAMGLLAEDDNGYVVAHDSASGFLVDSSGLAGRALLAGWAADALADHDQSADAELAALYAMAGRSNEAFTHARAGAFAASAVGASAEVVRLLGIALTFAPNETARREIDSLLNAFGRGHLALPAPAVPTPQTAETPPGVEQSTEVDEPDVIVEPLDQVDVTQPAVVSAPRTPLIRRATPRQWLVAIAVSIAIGVAGLFARRQLVARIAAAAQSDTLFLEERNARGQSQILALPQPLRARGSSLFSLASASLGPSWTDSLSAPFTSPLVSPDGRRVAIQRVTAKGQDLLVVAADRRDTIVVPPVGGDNLALGWSPDGGALLIERTRMLADGSLDSDLYLSWLNKPGESIAIDTSAARAVTEAKWAPTGTRIAWVARTGPTRQRDIYVSRPDGSGVRAVSPNPADDYAIDWSPDGSLLAFTSTRSGARRLYVYDFDDDRLWPVSDRDDEQNARFSPNGRTIAFESTRDGDRAIYIRPALGGTPRRLTPAGRQLSIAEWRGGAPTYVDRIRLVGATSVAVGDTTRLQLLALTRAGTPAPAASAQFKVLDADVVEADSGTGGLRAIGASAGSGRIVAVIPGWRSDTLTLLVSSSQPLHFEEDFLHGIGQRWASFGEPPPFVAAAPGSTARAVYPNGDLEWDSGILLRPTIQLRSGVRIQARVFAPFSGRPSAARLSVALVSAAAVPTIDRVAPRLNFVVATQWDGASGNLNYSVGPESSSEPANVLGNSGSHLVAMTVQSDSVMFWIDGRIRWRSSLKFLGDGIGAPVQLWIGSRATGATAAVSDVMVDLQGRGAAK